MNSSMVISRCLAAIAALSLGVDEALSQNLSSRPIRIIASEAGGSNDFSARLIAQGMSASLNQPVVVENRASAAVATEYLKKATPDGHTLMIYGSSIWLLQFLRDNVTWDPLKDFAPLSLTTRQFNVLIVHPSLPVGNIKELIALAKAKPKQLIFGVGTTGSATHLSGELMIAMAGIETVRVPFKGSTPAMNALLSNETQLMFIASSSGMPLIKSGRVKGLGVTSSEPTPLAPGLPTIASSGLPGYESVGLFGMFAPSKTPKPVMQQLNRIIAEFLQRPDTRQRYMDTGIDTVGSSPEQFAFKIKEEMARMGKVIRDAGIRAE